MRPRTTRSVAIAALVTGVVTGCGDDTANSSRSSNTPAAPTASGGSTPVVDPGDGGNYRPQLDPAQIAATIDNPYMPLSIGSRWRYEGDSDGEHEVIEVVVTPDRKTVMGISVFVVRDVVTVDGEVVEDTDDWFTQDTAGNVWYLGEESKEYDNGVVVGTEGSWEAGVDGALPGIVMPADPRVGDVYRQEFLLGEAEDMMKISGIGGTLTVGATTYTDVLTTRDWTPLEPDVIEEKSYAAGVGMIRESHVAGGDGYAELVEYTPGS